MLVRGPGSFEGLRPLACPEPVEGRVSADATAGIGREDSFFGGAGPTLPSLAFPALKPGSFAATVLMLRESPRLPTPFRRPGGVVRGWVAVIEGMLITEGPALASFPSASCSRIGAYNAPGPGLAYPTSAFSCYPPRRMFIRHHEMPCSAPCEGIAGERVYRIGGVEPMDNPEYEFTRSPFLGNS
jgi:hypothetical protein